jgi:predicted GNAT family N-acyltransferase
VPGPTPQAEYRVEILGPRHDRESFSCGVDALDNYFRRQAMQDFRKRVAAVFVLTGDGKTVAGYYTLSQYSVALDSLSPETARRLPRYPLVPATLLGRLAVSAAHRGEGLCSLLLMDALYRSLQGSHQLASAAVVVDAKNSAAAKFYRKYGFIPLPRIPSRLFLPMATIDTLFR